MRYLKIQTRYTSNINGRGQVLATCTHKGKRRQLTLGWDHALNSGPNHQAAATALTKRVMGKAPVSVVDGDFDNGMGSHTFRLVIQD